MTKIGGAILILAMYIALLIFLYSAPKRNKYYLRQFASIIIIPFVGYFFPLPTSLAHNFYYGYFRQFYFLFIVILFAIFNFRITLYKAFLMSISAYSMQQVIYSFNTIFGLTKFLNNISKGPLQYKEFNDCIIYLLFYIVFYFSIGKYASKYKYYTSKNKGLNIFVICIFVINSVFLRLPRFIGQSNSIVIQLYNMYLSSLTLCVQLILYRLVQINEERVVARRLLVEQQKQYEIKKDTIDAINIKIHDFKHLANSTIDNIETIRIKKLIEEFDSFSKTGNEVLDVILSDYSLRYGNKGIKFTFNGNANDISFISDIDVYALFGNALDNAVEALEKIDKDNEKIVSINLESKGSFVNLNIRNYFNGDLKEENGILKTSKTLDKECHGFGLKSMRDISRKYNGDLSYNVNNQIYSLNIYFLKP